MTDYEAHLWCSLCQAEHEPCEYHDDGIAYHFFTDDELRALGDAAGTSE